jgi:hypothetical protein
MYKGITFSQAENAFLTSFSVSAIRIKSGPPFVGLRNRGKGGTPRRKQQQQSGTTSPPTQESIMSTMLVGFSETPPINLNFWYQVEKSSESNFNLLPFTSEHILCGFTQFHHIDPHDIYNQLAPNKCRVEKAVGGLG